MLHESKRGLSVDTDPFGIRSPVKFENLEDDQQALIFDAAGSLHLLQDGGLDAYRVLASLPRWEDTPALAPEEPVEVWDIDPPWHYSSRPCHSKTKFGGGADKQYPMMRDRDILTPGQYIRDHSAENAVMFCWLTPPKMELGFAFIRNCGFRVVTKGFCWVKVGKEGAPRTGPGYYTASNTEDCWIGVRGKIKPDVRLVQEVILAERTQHSAKPPEALEKIEKMYPDRVKCEVFARRLRPGWYSVGNEVDGRDVRTSLARPLAESELDGAQEYLLDDFTQRFVELQMTGLTHWQICQLLGV